MTTELSKTYDPQAIEPRIFELWSQGRYFHAEPDGRPRHRRYTIMMPLPNVTGALHMGHAMDNVMQDILIRWHRMLGDNTLWMAGTDHAGIATQAVVEKRIFELEGKTRHDLGREGLLQRIWAWKDEYQARIYTQLKRMGCSCDWDRVRFTMDEVCTRAVRHAFLRMFRDGLIYRGKRLVNWDVLLQTAVADDELVAETVQGHFWHIRYPIKDAAPGGRQYMVVATTRPETMLGDTAVAVNPADERYRDVVGKTVILPLLNREMPVIADEWADPNLGSGCVKITPAHDPNDYNVGLRQKLPMINILNPDGTINENGGPYRGLDRFEARKKVVADLTALGLIEKIEERQMEVKHSDRSKTPVEPYLSDQWFVKMGDHEDSAFGGSPATSVRLRGRPGFAQQAIDAVRAGRVVFHPERYAKTYIDWLAEKRDWCISRQLWWGHRIPVWHKRVHLTQDNWTTELLGWGWDHYVEGGWGDEGIEIRIVRAADGRALDPGDDALMPVTPATEGDYDIYICTLDDSTGQRFEADGFKRDDDVLDTWFSSALWPHSTLGWPDPETGPAAAAGLAHKDGLPNCLNYYYPTSCLVTARDIITLWVARMVITGLYNCGDVPFSDVCIHANIQDGNGERMSKSKGNGIDPVDIIGAYGADAMRYTLAEMSTGTQDIRLPVTAICPQCGHHNSLTGRKPAAMFAFACDQCHTVFDVVTGNSDRPVASLSSERFDVGRAFCNKLWNAARFALMNLTDMPVDTCSRAHVLTCSRYPLEDRWILASLDRVVRECTRAMREYEFSAAVVAARDFFWNSLCDWYLELTKPRFKAGGPSAETAKQVLAWCLDQVLRLLHPFVPFITEALWQQLGRQAPHRGLPGLMGADVTVALVVAPWPEASDALVDDDAIQAMTDLQEMIRGIRDLRARHNIAPAKRLDCIVRCPSERAQALAANAHIVTHMAGLSALSVDPAARRPADAGAVVLGDVEIYVRGVIDPAAERKRLEERRTQLVKQKQGLESRLSNEKYVSRAPAEVVQQSRDQLAAAEAELATLEQELSSLGY